MVTTCVTTECVLSEPCCSQLVPAPKHIANGLLGRYYIVEEMLLHPQGGERYTIAAYILKVLEIDPPTHTKYHTIEGKRILSNVPPSPHPYGATQWVKAQTLGSESLGKHCERGEVR